MQAHLFSGVDSAIFASIALLPRMTACTEESGTVEVVLQRTSAMRGLRRHERSSIGMYHAPRAMICVRGGVKDNIPSQSVRYWRLLSAHGACRRDARGSQVRRQRARRM